MAKSVKAAAKKAAPKKAAEKKAAGKKGGKRPAAKPKLPEGANTPAQSAGQHGQPSRMVKYDGE